MMKIGKPGKKCILLMLMLTMIFSVSAVSMFAQNNVSGDDGIKVLINEEKIEFDTEPMLVSSRTFVPMRKIFETLGASVEWDGNTQKVTAVKGNTTITLQIDNVLATVDGKTVELDAAPFIVEGRTLVPLRFIAQSLGAEVGWDEKTSTVSIVLKTETSTSDDDVPAANDDDDDDSDVENEVDDEIDDDGKKIIKFTDVGVVDIAEPDENVYERRGGSWPDQIGTTILNGVEYDKRIYYKADLSSVIGKNITSAKLVIRERGMKYGARLYVYKITEDWDMSTVTYENAPAYAEENLIAQRLCEGYESSATPKELDITEYVKTLTSDNSVANIMIKATSEERRDASHIFGINSIDPPFIEIVLK